MKNEEFRYVIYKLTSPSGKVYIGQTGNFDNRMGSYSRAGCQKQHHLFAAILKYGWENFKKEIVYKSDSPENLDSVEIALIKFYRAIENGYNILSGGGGMRGLKHSEETKRKISENSKNISDETRAKISVAHKGKKRSKETRQRMSEVKKGEGSYNFGKKMPEAQRTKLSAVNMGKTVPMETRLKISRSMRGEKCRLSKITWAIASSIREEYKTGSIRQYELAVKYGVCRDLISKIVLNKIWKI